MILRLQNIGLKSRIIQALRHSCILFFLFNVHYIAFEVYLSRHRFGDLHRLGNMTNIWLWLIFITDAHALIVQVLAYLFVYVKVENEVFVSRGATLNFLVERFHFKG